MCFDERNTDSRSRVPAAALTARRTRAVRRSVWVLNLAMVASLLLLAFLAEDVFAGVLHALALVRLGLAEAADLRRHLADLLAVDPGDYHLGRLRRHDRDAGRDRIDHVVAVAERDLQVLALHGGTIADAGNLELLLEALGHPGDQVRHQRARGAPHGARALGLVARVDLDRALLQLGRDLGGQHELEGALRALHLHGLAVDARRHAGRDGDRLLADTGHGRCLCLRTPCTGSRRR